MSLQVLYLLPVYHCSHSTVFDPVEANICLRYIPDGVPMRGRALNLLEQVFEFGAAFCGAEAIAVESREISQRLHRSWRSWRRRRRRRSLDVVMCRRRRRVGRREKVGTGASLGNKYRAEEEKYAGGGAPGKPSSAPDHVCSRIEETVWPYYKDLEGRKAKVGQGGHKVKTLNGSSKPVHVTSDAAYFTHTYRHHSPHEGQGSVHPTVPPLP
jgi:hypothetical protein